MIHHQYPGIDVRISAAAHQKYADEQRMQQVPSVHTSILIGSAAGLVLTFGGMVISKILGA